VPKATTVRFTEEVYARLDQASSRTGLPVNSIVIAACLEWMQRHTPVPGEATQRLDLPHPALAIAGVAPRWATLRRAVELAVGKRTHTGAYPFERFTEHAKQMLTFAQAEAEKLGHSYIGTEHLLLAAFGSEEFYSAKILATLGVAIGAVRSSIDEHLSKPKIAHRSPMIPTSRVKRVIEIAFEQCSARDDPRVGTHHILLALGAEGHGIAAHVLNDLGATTDKIGTQMDLFSESEA
jgi:hypothetical protein